MNNQIGQSVTLNGKTYQITGVEKRSFILELEGKKFKATQDKINKILAQNSQPKVEFPYLENRLKMKRLWKKDAQLPVSEKEIMEWFESLSCELSPENLSCDGELSRTQVNLKLQNIRGAWRELEVRLGRKVTESEVENKMMNELTTSLRK